MEWAALLSTLWVQTSHIGFAEFMRLAGLQGLMTPKDLASETLCPDLRNFLIENPNWWRVGEGLLKELREAGIEHTWPGRGDYPMGLLDLEDPPLFLTYLGRPVWATHRLLSVVGSRDPAPATLRWLEFHLREIVAGGVALVSGGARGADQAAHAACLRNGTPTIAILPSGLFRPYPSNFQDWIGPILESGGAILSELRLTTEMRKHYFVKRNRMIGSISPMTLIAEARRSSGTTITAHRAHACGRSVGVVPGPPDDKRWTGTLDLLASGSHLVRDAADVSALLSLSEVAIRPSFS